MCSIRPYIIPPTLTPDTTYNPSTHSNHLHTLHTTSNTPARYVCRDARYNQNLLQNELTAVIIFQTLAGNNDILLQETQLKKKPYFVLRLKKQLAPHCTTLRTVFYTRARPIQNERSRPNTSRKICSKCTQMIECNWPTHISLYSSPVCSSNSIRY